MHLKLGGQNAICNPCCLYSSRFRRPVWQVYLQRVKCGQPCASPTGSGNAVLGAAVLEYEGIRDSPFFGFRQAF